ncbi:MAG: hypothetical protein R3D98_13815 [Candidatus Krumholzibacteriia bacterium]
MKDLGYGRDYEYAHDTQDGVAAMRCLPEAWRTAASISPAARAGNALLARLERIEAWHRDHAQRAERNDPPAGGDS